MISGSAGTASGRPSTKLDFGNTLRPNMSWVRATTVQSVQSFAHLRMPGITTKVDITRACETIIWINKDITVYLHCSVDVEFETAIAQKMGKLGDLWQCQDCLWTTRYKTRLWEHIEAKHVKSGGYSCPLCNKFCPSKNAWHLHKSRYHKGCWNTRLEILCPVECVFL